MDSNRIQIYSAGCLIVDKNGMMLLGHPTNHHKDSWTIPKGQINKGESEMDAAIRETKEETGIDVVKLYDEGKAYAPHYFNEGNYKIRKRIIKNLTIYLVKLKGSFQEMDLKPYCESMVDSKFPELDEFKWVNIAKYKKYLVKSQKDIFNDYYNNVIIRNAIKTPDGTIIESIHRHDYKTHDDKLTGAQYMVDGGMEYLRYSIYGHPKEETLFLSANSDYELVRKHFKWGSRGKDGKNPIKFIPLYMMGSNHIKAILDNNIASIKYIYLFNKELLYRKKHNIELLETDYA